MALGCIVLAYGLFLCGHSWHTHGFEMYRSGLCSVFCRDGHSVLVHGSEGTDSTLLVSSLAQLILDPASRTLTGFLGLLERDWIQVNV